MGGSKRGTGRYDICGQTGTHGGGREESPYWKYYCEMTKRCSWRQGSHAHKTSIWEIHTCGDEKTAALPTVACRGRCECGGISSSPFAICLGIPPDLALAVLPVGTGASAMDLAVGVLPVLRDSPVSQDASRASHNMGARFTALIPLAQRHARWCALIICGFTAVWPLLSWLPPRQRVTSAARPPPRPQVSTWSVQ